MKDKLLPFDRRMEILFMIISKRKVTRRELSMEFGVSDDVIDRDIVVLSRYIPLDIKRGRYGGIVLMDEYSSIKVYLNKDEENVLIDCMKYVDEKNKCHLKSILHKFSMPHEDIG